MKFCTGAGSNLHVNLYAPTTPVAGQQFDYAFDDIGNRQTTTRDGRQATYSPNILNQYTSRTVPGFVNILGTATNTATVSLWSQDNLALYTPTTRQGDYFRGEMLFNNNTGALWFTITNVAVLSNYTGADIVTNIAGNLLLAKNPEAFTYDVDGNLTSDSLWTNVWNGENRRIVIERRSDAPSLSKVKEAWTLLADGRWIERIVSTNNGMSYYPSQTNRYVWDNQVLLAVLDHTNGVVVSFLRGIDMSGSIQGAGGVGGVLAVKAGTSAQCDNMANTTHFTCYDGNGNVTALVNAATGAESARYAYGPFAEPLQRTGPMAKLNPIRFSTQYHDDYTEDDKYLFRDLRDGRWLNRDLIGERGGMNLYGFVRNEPIDSFDKLGLAAWTWDTPITSDYSISYDSAMTLRRHGPPTSYRRGTWAAEAYAHSLGGLNDALFQHYLHGGGTPVDLTSDATLKGETIAALTPKMNSAQNDIRKKAESFKCPSLSSLLEGIPNVLGDTKFSSIDRTGFTSSIWVIKTADAGLSKQCNAIVVCFCNGEKFAVLKCDFHMYFYDQFADAANLSHKPGVVTEWIGGTQFDETGAWGRVVLQTGYYR